MWTSTWQLHQVTSQSSPTRSLTVTPPPPQHSLLLRPQPSQGDLQQVTHSHIQVLPPFLQRTPTGSGMGVGGRLHEGETHRGRVGSLCSISYTSSSRSPITPWLSCSSQAGGERFTLQTGTKGKGGKIPPLKQKKDMEIS